MNYKKTFNFLKSLPVKLNLFYKKKADLILKNQGGNGAVRELADRIVKSLNLLDSFDLEWRSPHQSCAHHLKELASIKKLLKKDTLVVVDDSPISGYLQQSKTNKKTK